MRKLAADEELVPLPADRVPEIGLPAVTGQGYGRPVGCCMTMVLRGRLLGLLLKTGPRLVAADLVLQRAVVRKYAGQRTPRTHRMSTGLVVPRHAFRPPPRVDSAVLIVRRR